MTILFFHRKDADRRRTLRGVPRDLPSHLMRDIGLNPWPDRPRSPFHPLW